MAGLAVIGGNATRGIDLDGDGWVAVDRHAGDDGYTLPHLIDHVANLRALRDAGCDRVLGIASVGGLHPQYGPGGFLCPHDFVSLDDSTSALDGVEAHSVVGFDVPWRSTVVEAWADAASPPLVDGGIYWQARGPRLETAAEIAHISRDADVIGMTVGSECTAASELGLAYAVICAVVNYANGVGDEELTPEEVAGGARATREELADALDALLPRLA
jgi:5'-methylthioadenosine phosphorylase